MVNLIGKRFGKFTVLSKSKNIDNKSNKSKRSFTAWNCECECGNILVIRTSTLTSGLQKSCGCIVSKYGTAIKVGDKYNQLTAVSYDGGYWKCLCDCGEYTTTITHHLISGNTKSCGCLKIKKAKENQKQSVKVNTKYAPNITSARRIYKSYCKRNIIDLSFDGWFKITQQNCNYCGIEPNQKYNYFKNKVSASIYAKENGYFTYNGIDRVDNNKGYVEGNVVSCCWTCNRAKSDRNYKDYYDYIGKLRTNYKINLVDLELPESYKLVSVKIAYKNYLDNYGKMEIDLKTFYLLSQLECVYCGQIGVNCYNVYLKDKKASSVAKAGAFFNYNGIDRIDNTKTHTIDNVVPCCKYCNFAKSKLNHDEFNDWIYRIKNFNK
jgi:hypothetical protein